MTARVERLAITASDSATLQARLWESDAPPRGVVQIAHGAAEHLGRYDRFAHHLAAAGYAVIGADHRGHGENTPHGLASFGPRGFAGVIDDMATVTRTARGRWPGVPLVLFGHSMGSFAAQAFLADHPDLCDGLILSGTAAIDEVIAVGDLGTGLAAMNAGFEPARTPFDWLSRDPAEVDAYVADPLCGFDIELASLATMPAAVFGVRAPDRLAGAVARNLPICLISGENDPIGAGETGPSRVAARYAEAGLRDIEHNSYPGGRHEMLNEVNREAVTSDVINWLWARF